ncbi:MAG: MFS transporter [Chloroflexi bacterium]|nr:MFS transporter [Chloroflexota bacterium]
MSAAPGPSAAPDPPPPRARPLATAAIACFWTSLYLYVPVLPLHAADLGASLSMVGTIVASYAIAQLLLRIPLGVAADLVGRRRPFALASLALSGVAALWLAIAPDPWSLFWARSLTGLAAAGWVVISVLYAAYYPPERATSATSAMMGANTVGILIATPIGATIADLWDVRTTFLVASGVAAVGMVLLAAAPEPTLVRSRYSAATFARVIRRPTLWIVSLAAISLIFVTFATTFGFLPLLAEERGAGTAQVGWVATVAVGAALPGVLMTPALVERVGVRGTLLAASVVSAAALLAMPATLSWELVAALQVPAGWGRGVLTTLLLSLALRAAPPSELATAMGVYQATYSVGMFAGPALSGAVAEWWGIGAVFYVSALVTLAGLALAYVWPGAFRVAAVPPPARAARPPGER